MNTKFGIVALMAMAGFSASADTPSGPGAFTVETATDVSYVGDGFAVPEDAAVTFYPGVFCPKGDGGPLNVREIVWRNVNLSDIEAMSAEMMLSTGVWVPTETFHVVSNADGSVQCQFQYDGSPYHGFIMVFAQNGPDVEAYIRLVKYQYGGKEGQNFGADLTKIGGEISMTDLPWRNDWNIGNLSCRLRTEVEHPIAPSEIAFTSTDESAPDIVEFVHRPCLMEENVFICRDLRFSDIETLSGEISIKNINKGAWTEVNGYCRTVTADYTQINLMYGIEHETQIQRLGVNVRFTQSGRDVLARCVWAGHSYASKGTGLDEPFGIGVIGVSLGLTNEANTASFAVRNLKIGIRPAHRIIAVHEDCVMKTGNWDPLWPGIKLTDVVPGTALMGGYSLGSTWHVCSNYLWKAVDGEPSFTSFYEYLRGSSLFTVGMKMRQFGEDVVAKVQNVRVTSGAQPGSGQIGNYATTLTNRVDVKAEDGNSETIALCNLTAGRFPKRRHTVAVDETFRAGFAPVRLSDVKLAFTPASGTECAVTETLLGFGAIGVGGSGKVLLGTDLGENIDLEVDSGTAVIAADRTVESSVRVAAGATLEFRFSGTLRPKLETDQAILASGVKIVLSGTLADVPEEGAAIKLMTGCHLAPEDVAVVTLEPSSDLTSRYKFRLFIDADGDLAVTANPKKGLLLIFR